MYAHDIIQFPDECFPPFSSVSEIYKETETISPKPLIEANDYFLLPSPLTLHRSIFNSHCLFFVRYIPENTFKPCWFLAKINHAETALLNLDSQYIGDYHITFISRYTDDSHLCNDSARW